MLFRSVPLQVLVDKFTHARFEPSGMTRNPEIRFAKSIVDYIFRWMASKFLSHDKQIEAGLNVPETVSAASVPTATAAGGAVSTTDPAGPMSTIRNQEDAPPCSTCGCIPPWCLPSGSSPMWRGP